MELKLDLTLTLCGGLGASSYGESGNNTMRVYKASKHEFIYN